VATAERTRVAETRAGTHDWRLFGPYLSERQWGTVREDYSLDGTAWDYFPHDHARSRTYRWGEDGLGGFSDVQQRLCLGVALWNTHDPILKERLFGLTGPEGNHGEDVKELYYFLDATPSHAWNRMLYKYPQAAYPYAELVARNRARGKSEPEFELTDTGVLAGGRYFDVFIDYAKGAPEDVLMRVRVCNRGPEDAPIVVVPQAWYRNTWSWGDGAARPTMRGQGGDTVALAHPTLGAFTLHADAPDRLAFCDNDTNHRRLHGATDAPGYFKDGLHALIVDGDEGAVNPAQVGTKVGAIWRRTVPAGGEVVLRVRLGRTALAAPFDDFDATFARREAEAEAHWDLVHGAVRDPD